MAVCQYYLRGQCKFGSMCKFEHPAQRPSGFGNPMWGSQGQGQNAAANTGPATISFTQDGIAKDMTPGIEKPLWPLSSYGPAKMEPTLIANLDESPEELRWKAIQALKSGNTMEYQKYESERIQTANQTFANALANVGNVYKQAYNVTVAAQKGLQIPLSASQASTVSTFGKPSAFRGGSAFGSSSTAAPVSAFGSSAASPVSAFGKPAFGQSAFGQPAFGQSAFGQPSKPISAFGQPMQAASAFGQPAQGTSGFTQPAQGFGGGGQQQQATTSAFGQTSQPQSSFIQPATAFGSRGGGAFSAFTGSGTSVFGTSAQQAPSAPAFGQPSFGGNAAAPTLAFGNVAQNTSASATTSQPVSAFGQPTKPVPAFGQPTFGQPSQPISAFGEPSQPSQPPSAFGLPAKPVTAFGQPSQPASAFAQPVSAFGQVSQSASAFGTGVASLPAKPKFGQPDFAAALTACKAQEGRDKHDGLLPEDYADRLPASAKEAFEAARFEWGCIPEWVPPVQLR